MSTIRLNSNLGPEATPRHQERLKSTEMLLNRLQSAGRLLCFGQLVSPYGNLEKNPEVQLNFPPVSAEWSIPVYIAATRVVELDVPCSVDGLDSIPYLMEEDGHLHKLKDVLLTLQDLNGRVVVVDDLHQTIDASDELQTMKLLADELERKAHVQSRLAEYKPGSWFIAESIEEMTAFYRHVIPKIREVAQEKGYAIAVHGSMERDLDLVAVAWVERPAEPEELAHAIAMVCCGMTRSVTYDWEQKPLGRVATSIPIVWPPAGAPEGAGHIDLSVVS